MKKFFKTAVQFVGVAIYVEVWLLAMIMIRALSGLALFFIADLDGLLMFPRAIARKIFGSRPALTNWHFSDRFMKWCDGFPLLKGYFK